MGGGCPISPTTFEPVELDEGIECPEEPPLMKGHPERFAAFC